MTLITSPIYIWSQVFCFLVLWKTHDLYCKMVVRPCQQSRLLPISMFRLSKPSRRSQRSPLTSHRKVNCSAQSVGDRALAAVPYLLPMCDALRYGMDFLPPDPSSRLLFGRRGTSMASVLVVYRILFQLQTTGHVPHACAPRSFMQLH